MAEMQNITATVRSGTGKGAARRARREGLVPGVVYGNREDPIAITLKFNELLKNLKAGRFLSTLFNLKLDGHDDVRVICRNVQRDVVKDFPTHVDLMRLNRNSRVNLHIPVVFINEEECEGLKRGGVLTMVRPEVELKVTAGDIPEQLVVDLEGLDIGDIVHISDIEMPKGSRPMITDRDFVVANISAPSSLKSSGTDDEEEIEEEEGVEGEAAEEEKTEE